MRYSISLRHSRLMQLGGIAGKLVGNLLLLGDGEGVDAQVVADARHHEPGPAEIDDHGKGKVGPQVVEFQLDANLGKSNSGKVSDDRTADERVQHNGPVGEGLARQVGEDHLGGEAAKDERHGEAEEDKVVVLHERAVRRKDPERNRDGVDGHGNPLEEDGQDGEAVGAAGLDNVEDAERNLGKDERADNETNPDVSEGSLAQKVSKAGEAAVQTESQRLSPDLRAPDTRHDHDGASDEDTFGGTVDDAEVEGVRVVRLPGREEHGEAGAQRGEDASWRSAQTHGGRLEQTGEGAVEGIDSVVEELAEAARGSCSSRLLAVKVIHSLVHEETKSEAEVNP